MGPNRNPTNKTLEECKPNSLGLKENDQVEEIKKRIMAELNLNIEKTIKEFRKKDSSGDPNKKKIVRRIKKIQGQCGDLCDTTKSITPGHFLGSVTAKVD